MNSKENIMQKVSSWITVLTFPGCLLLTNYKHYSSLCNDLSIWIALLGMLNFTVFFPSLLLMAVSGAHFTHLQITVLLISAMLITMKAYVPFLGFIYTHVQTTLRRTKEDFDIPIICLLMCLVQLNYVMSPHMSECSPMNMYAPM